MRQKVPDLYRWTLVQIDDDKLTFEFIERTDTDD